MDQSLFRAWHLVDNQWNVAHHVSIADRGFRYGASVFESIYIHQGNPAFWKEHQQQFRRARTALGDRFQEPLYLDHLLPQVCSFLNNEMGMLRLVATEGEGSISDLSVRQEVYAYVEPIREPPFLPQPKRVVVFPEPFAPSLSGHKTGSYLFHVRARRFAQISHKDEAILQSCDGQWICASMANIFLIKEGRIFTPPCTSGAREGVVRDWVKRQLEVRECEFSQVMIESAEGFFLTNSRIGIQEIIEVGNRPISRWQGIVALQKAYVQQMDGDHQCSK